MSLAFFPRSRVTTTSGGGEEHPSNLPVAPARSLPAGRAWPEGGEGKGNASEEEKAMAAWSLWVEETGEEDALDTGPTPGFGSAILRSLPVRFTRR